MSTTADNIALHAVALWQHRDERNPDWDHIAELLTGVATMPITDRWPVFSCIEEILLAAPVHVRPLALRCLAGASGPDVWPHFVEALSSEDPALRLAGFDALRDSARQDPTRWIHALLHSDPVTRREAMEHLPFGFPRRHMFGLLGDPVTHDACVAALRLDAFDPADAAQLLEAAAAGTLDARQCETALRSLVFETDFDALLDALPDRGHEARVAASASADTPAALRECLTASRPVESSMDQLVSAAWPLFTDRSEQSWGRALLDWALYPQHELTCAAVCAAIARAACIRGEWTAPLLAVCGMVFPTLLADTTIAPELRREAITEMSALHPILSGDKQWLAAWRHALGTAAMQSLFHDAPLHMIAALPLPDAPWTLAEEEGVLWVVMVDHALASSDDGAVELLVAASRWQEPARGEAAAMVAAAWRPAFVPAWVARTRTGPISTMSALDLLPPELRDEVLHAIVAATMAGPSTGRREIELLARELVARIAPREVSTMLALANWVSPATDNPLECGDFLLAMAASRSHRPFLTRAIADRQNRTQALLRLDAENTRRAYEEIVEATAEERRQILSVSDAELPALVAEYVGRATIGVISPLMRRSLNGWEASKIATARLLLLAHDDIRLLAGVAHRNWFASLFLDREEVLCGLQHAQRWPLLGAALANRMDQEPSLSPGAAEPAPRTAADLACGLRDALALTHVGIASALVAYLRDALGHDGCVTPGMVAESPELVALLERAVGWAAGNGWHGDDVPPHPAVERARTGQLNLGPTLPVRILELVQATLPALIPPVAAHLEWKDCIATSYETSRHARAQFFLTTRSPGALRRYLDYGNDGRTNWDDVESALQSTDPQIVSDALQALLILQGPFDEITTRVLLDDPPPARLDVIARARYGRPPMESAVTERIHQRILDPTIPPEQRVYLALAASESPLPDHVPETLVRDLASAGAWPMLHSEDYDHAKWHSRLLYALLAHMIVGTATEASDIAVSWIAQEKCDRLSRIEKKRLMQHALAGRDHAARATAMSASRYLLTKARDAAGAPALMSFTNGQDDPRADDLARFGAQDLARIVRSALLTGPSASDGTLFDRTGTARSRAEILRNWLVFAAEHCKGAVHAVERVLMQLASTSVDDRCRAQALAALRKQGARHPCAQRLAELLDWGEETALRMTGRRFEIALLTDDNLGYTVMESSTIHVNPLPMVRAEPNGEAIVRGLILHEIGHHMYHRTPEHIATMNAAREEDLDMMLNLVLDEHLERNLRARNRSFGEDFQALAAYAFLHRSRETSIAELLRITGPNAWQLAGMPMAPGKEPGHVRLSARAVFDQIARSGRSFGRFVRALRMGSGNRTGDPKVAVALQLFGTNFRRSDAADLLGRARRLREIFADEARMIELMNLAHQMALSAAELAATGLSPDEVEELRPSRREDASAKSRTAADLNTEHTNAFKEIHAVVRLPHAPQAHAALAARVRTSSARLRRQLLDLGIASVTIGHQAKGRRVDRVDTVHRLLASDARLLRDSRRMPVADLFIGAAIDCSGSMAGDKMDLARCVATLVAEACRGVSGVDLRLIGFTDDKLFDAGSADRCAAHALESSGGNNDAAALWYTAQLALASRRSARLLLMISDGSPTECSVDSLRALVDRLTRRGLLCAQVAIETPSQVCFPHHVVIKKQEMNEAIADFGTTIGHLVRQTLRGQT